VAEDDDKRRDRELIELLNELRVALPGVQVLFAFLLTVPFTQRFQILTPAQKNVYFVSVLATAAASALLIAPTAYHRVRWRSRDKERMLNLSNTLSIWGTAFLALAITLVVYVITDVLFGGWLTLVVTILLGALFVGLWYVLPLSGRKG
jgi:hypothetical protein